MPTCCAGLDFVIAQGYEGVAGHTGDIGSVVSAGALATGDRRAVSPIPVARRDKLAAGGLHRERSMGVKWPPHFRWAQPAFGPSAGAEQEQSKRLLGPTDQEREIIRVFDFDEHATSKDGEPCRSTPIPVTSSERSRCCSVSSRLTGLANPGTAWRHPRRTEEPVSQRVPSSGRHPQMMAAMPVASSDDSPGPLDPDKAQSVAF